MIIAFTGAGISQASGIATFMERPEVRDQLHRGFATQNPQTYYNTIKMMVEEISIAEPNAAHEILADMKIPIITMNIDGLHEKSGSSDVLNLHGTLPRENELENAHTLFNKPVLYGDPAPNYERAIQVIESMTARDTLLIIGASVHTQIAVYIREIAILKGVKIIEIQKDAVTNVPKTLEMLKP